MADARSAAGDEGVHVNVILRCRPANTQEVAERAPQVIQCNEALREVTLYQNVGGKSLSRTFRYDKVFGPDSHQEKVYSQAIVPIVQEVLEGFNCTIFAYGQTGTGKTYTMEGGPRNSSDGKKLSAEAGVIPRAIKQIFDAIESDEVTDSSVKVSFMELYNEELTDLLSVTDDKDKRLRLLEDRSGVVVQGLEEMVVKNAAEIYQVLDRGTAKRRTAETLLNKRSSRSHSVFTVTIHMKETTPEGEDVIKIGKLNLVDLAGSENISRSGAKDGRAREAGNINQSLLTLGRVITALVEHSGHVPYRDSKLTRLLRDSLGGKTKTCIIATIAPSVQCVEETISTLDYAHRAKNIRNRPEVNQRISKTTMIKELTTEIERLKMDLVATREKNGIFISAERYEQYELERAQLREVTTRNKAEIEALTQQHAEEMDELTQRAAASEARLLARLETAEGRLRETEGRLAEAQVSIQERDFIILSHRRSEQAIAAHASDVGRDLGSAASDLSEAIARLRASLDVTGGDRRAIREMASDAAARAEELRAALRAAAAAQADKMASLAAAGAELRERKGRELAALREEVAALGTKAEAARAAVEAAASKAASGAGAAVAALAGPQREALQAASAAATAAASAAGAALDKLAAALEAQASEVSAFAERGATGAAMAAETARDAMARAADGLGAAKGGIEGLRSLAAEATGAASEALSRFASDFDASARGREAQLVSEISGLLSAFVAERRDAVAAAVADARSKLVEGGKAVDGAAGDAAKAAAAAAKALKADGAAFDKELTKQLSALKKASEATAASLSSSGTAAASARSDLARAASDIARDLSATSEALSKAEKGGLAAIEAGRAAAATAAAKGAKAVAVASGALQKAAEKGAEADGRAADGIEAAAREAGEAIAAFAKQHADGLAGAASAVDAAAAAALATAPPSMPEERFYRAPEEGRVADLCCPPQEVLLEYFRAQRAAVIESGGDPSELLQMVAPEGPERSGPSSSSVTSATLPTGNGALTPLRAAASDSGTPRSEAAGSQGPGDENAVPADVAAAPSEAVAPMAAEKPAAAAAAKRVTRGRSRIPTRLGDVTNAE